MLLVRNDFYLYFLEQENDDHLDRVTIKTAYKDCKK